MKTVRRNLKYKFCKGCGQYLNVDNFSKNKHMKDGLNSLCRDCNREYQAKYRINNRDRINRRAKKYRDEYDIWR